MIKRVIVFNNIAKLEPNTIQQYYDYIDFIQPPFKKTFYTMFNNVDIPAISGTIQKRIEYFEGEADKIIEALNQTGIHNPAIEKDTEEWRVIRELIIIYLTNYEKDGRFEKPDFQESFFSRIKKIYNEDQEIVFRLPDEYIYIYHLAVRKLLWYYTTVDLDRDNRYINGDVDELLTYLIKYSDWFNNYEANATAPIVEEGE